MHALNSMQIPKGLLDNVVNFPRPQSARGAVAHFAEGGAVGAVGSVGASASVRGSNSGIVENHFHFHMDASDLLSEDQVRRKVIPVIDKVLRRGG
jgi:hypothetical protein